MRRFFVIGVPVLAVIALAAAGTVMHLHPADLLRDASQRMTNSDVRGAILDLDAFLRAHPNDKRALFQLGMANLSSGNPIAAERDFRQARDAGYDPAATTLPLGQAMLLQNRLADILAEFNPARTPPGARGATLALRAAANLGLNHPREALANARDAAAASPNDPDVLLLAGRVELATGDSQAAAGLTARVLSLQPGRPEAMLQQAEVKLQQGQAEAALKLALDVLNANPRRLDAITAAARIQAALHQDAKAITLIDRVLKALPKDISANFLRAVLAIHQRDYTTAETCLAVVSPVIDQLPMGNYYLALTELGRNQFAQAQDAAQKYAARAPNDPNGIKLLAYSELMLNHPDRVLTLIRPLLDPAHPDPDAFGLAARAQGMQGDIAGAKATLQTALRAAPGNTDMLNRLAAADIATGDTGKGQAELRQSLTLAPNQPITARALVEADLAAGDIPGAEAAVQHLRAAAGETEQAGILAAQVALARLDIDAASSDYENVLKRFPDSRDATFGLVQVESRQGDPKAAAERLSAWMARHPADKLGLAMQIQYDRGQGNLKAAIAAAETAHDADPNDRDITAKLAELYLADGEADRAVSLLDRAGPSDPDLLLRRGQALQAEGKPQQAADIYSRVMQTRPDSTEARLGLLSIAMRAQDFAQARAIATDALKTAPGNAHLLNALVIADLKQNGKASALALAQSLQQNPANLPAAYILPGVIAQTGGDIHAAAQAYADAFRDHPSEPLMVVAVSALESIGRAKDAIPPIEDFAAKHPESVEAQRLLSLYYVREHDAARAMPHLDRVIQADQSDSVALNNRAWLRAQQGDLPGARHDAERAYYLHPDTDTEDTLGWILLRQGDPKQALKLLEQAASSHPAPDILYHYAAALQASGRTADARDAVKRSLADARPFDGRDAAVKLAAEVK
jgi:putative PEP-CTERM system TPR-repeat lipoprotein